MGKHGDPNRKDTNPFGQIFRDYEPSHTGFEGDDDPPPEHTVPPVERTGEIEPFRPDGDGLDAPFLPVPDQPTEIFRIGAPPVAAFEPDPAPYPDEPGWTQDDADRETAANRSPRWPLALGLSVALCAALAAGAVGRATAPSEPVSDDYSPRTVATVTLTPTPKTSGPKRSSGKPQPIPTVTEWRTRTPSPLIKVSPVPGPTIRTTQFITPKPVVSVRISRVPVPGPTVTCEITITVNRNGIEVEPREESGDC